VKKHLGNGTRIFNKGYHKKQINIDEQHIALPINEESVLEQKESL
jgi:hypothetical protein